jgi:hypothetical protein
LAEFQPGDLVVLKSGSMRMVVERVEDERAHLVWAHEGAIGRDALPVFMLSKWEDRGPRDFGDRPDRKPRSSGDRPDRKSFGDKPERKGKPAGKPGMDGKPRQKTYYRKDD